VLDRAAESELDFHTVSQLTAMGALADEVMGDLIRVGAGLMKGQESEALRSVADIFRRAAEMQSTPMSGLWDANGLPDALRLLADSSNVRQPFSATEDARAWIASLAHDLGEVVCDSADGEVLARLEGAFSSISSATLGATNESLHLRGYASTWLM